jgi:dynein heavy chain
LYTGLAGERIRWEETVKDLEERMGFLIGDCLIAAAFMSYIGPFLSNYRDELVHKVWLAEVMRTLFYVKNVLSDFSGMKKNVC